MFLHFCFIPPHGKNDLKSNEMGPGGLFPTNVNPNLADILGRTDLNFENYDFFYDLDPAFLDFQVSISPNSQISIRRLRRNTNSQIPT